MLSAHIQWSLFFLYFILFVGPNQITHIGAYIIRSKIIVSISITDLMYIHERNNWIIGLNSNEKQFD